MSDRYDDDFDNRRLLSDLRSIEAKVERIDDFRKVQADGFAVLGEKLLTTWRRTEISLYLHVITIGLLIYVAFFR